MKEKRSFSHLSLYEREQLFVYKQQGKCLREIGRLLDRDHSVISRELKGIVILMSTCEVI